MRNATFLSCLSSWSASSSLLSRTELEKIAFKTVVCCYPRRPRIGLHFPPTWLISQLWQERAKSPAAWHLGRAEPKSGVLRSKPAVSVQMTFAYFMLLHFYAAISRIYLATKHRLATSPSTFLCNAANSLLSICPCLSTYAYQELMKCKWTFGQRCHLHHLKFSIQVFEVSWSC